MLHIRCLNLGQGIHGSLAVQNVNECQCKNTVGWTSGSSSRAPDKE